MKKILVFIVFAMFFAFPALAKEYRIRPLGMTIDIPDTYTVYIQDSNTPGDERSVEEINALLDEGNFVLVAKDTENKRSFMIFKAFEHPNGNINIKTATDAEREAFISFHRNTFGEKNKMHEDVIVTDDTEFHKYRRQDGIEYATAIHGFGICFAMLGANEVMTEEEIAEGDRLVQSVRFDDTLENLQNEIEAEEAETKRVRRVDFASFMVVLAVLLVLIAVIAWVISGRRRKRGQ